MAGKIGFALGWIGCLALAACSTVDSRIKEKPAVYSSLSPRDQALVKSGMIREGLPEARSTSPGVPLPKSVQVPGTVMPMKLGSTPRLKRLLPPTISIPSSTASDSIVTRGIGSIHSWDRIPTATRMILSQSRFPIRLPFLKGTAVPAGSTSGITDSQ